MTPQLPPLVPNQPSVGLKFLSLISPGVRQIRNQIEPYTQFWSDQNQKAISSSKKLLVAVGDSTAIGIGASTPENGYVGLVKAALERRDEKAWRVVNLGLSGARVADALERQMPILAQLPQPDCVVCCIGTNNVVWEAATASLNRQLQDLTAKLPKGTLVGDVAGQSVRARLANRTLHSACDQNGLVNIQPWSEPGPRRRLARDRFHPNDVGYTLMARPYARALDAPEPELVSSADGWNS